jgi:type I restriction enzyme, S subunit
MVPNGWQIRTISDLLDRVNKPVTVEPNVKYREIGIRSHCKGIFYKTAVTGKSLGDKRVFQIEPDCFVVNIVFAWEQAVARTTKNELGMIASHRFPMFKPKNNLCDIDYILYLFKTDYGKHLLSLASPGGAGRNKTLGQAEFARLEISAPPVEEQKKIANILSTWDKAISTTEILLNNSHQQKKGLMQQLLTGKKRFSDFSGEWKKKSLIDIALIIMGSSPKSEAYNKNGNGLPLLQGNADIKNRISTPRIFTSEITKECLSDDILLSVRAPVGAVAVSQHHACIGRGIAAIRAKENISQSYIYQFLLGYEECWGRISQGSTFESVNSDDIKNIKLNLPELEEQEKIAAVLKSADREIEALQQKLNCLKQEKKALMQQLLTGKKRVTIN